MASIFNVASCALLLETVSATTYFYVSIRFVCISWRTVPITCDACVHTNGLVFASHPQECADLRYRPSTLINRRRHQKEISVKVLEKTVLKISLLARQRSFLTSRAKDGLPCTHDIIPCAPWNKLSPQPTSYIFPAAISNNECQRESWGECSASSKV